MEVNNDALISWIFDHSVFRDLYGGNSSSSDSSDEDDNLPEPTRAPRSLKARYSVQDRYNSLFFNTYLSQEALQDGASGMTILGSDLSGNVDSGKRHRMAYEK